MGRSGSIVLAPGREFTRSTVERLERAGFEVFVADTVPETLALVEDRSVDCVVSGCGVTDAEGLQYMGFRKLLEALDERETDVPCVLYPPFDDKRFLEHGRDAGVIDYIPNVDGEHSTERLVSRVAEVVDHRRTERRAAELKRINEIIREVNRTLVRSTTREEALEAVCRKLVDGDAYRFAWIGTVEGDRTTALAAAPDRWRSLELPSGPVGAVLSGEDIRTIPECRPAGVDRSRPLAVGIVRIRHQSTDYGVMAVGVDRRESFPPGERDVLVELGETIGHRLAAIETHRLLERQNERLDQFAEMVSHDLETPLSVARMQLEMADPDADGHLAEVESALDRMEGLIDDVFELARGGEQVVSPSPVDLDAVVGLAWSSIDAPGATVRVDRLGRVLGDRGRLRQLLVNLFRNAVEHGPSTRSRTREDSVDLTVRVGRLDDREGFYVEDDGEGFPEAGFDPFEAGTSSKADGRGFGLSIVREIALAHGWTVEATTGTDGGARIEFAGVEWVPEDRA